MSLRQTPLTCSGHTRPVVDLAFSAVNEHGYFLISACKDGKPMLRQGETGDWIGTFTGHKGAVWGVDLDKTARKAASGAADFCAKVWDSVKGEEVASFTHNHIVKSVNFSSDSSQLLTASNEKVLRIFDLTAYDKEPLLFKGHTSGIKKAVFVSDNKRAVSVSDDKTIRLWDCSCGEELQKIELPSAPSDLEVSSDGNILVIPYGRVISFWNTETLTKIKEYTVPTQVNSASLHPDRNVFVYGGEDFKMYKYDYESGAEIDSFKGHFGPIHCVRFSPDGELYGSGSEDGTLRLWQTTVGKTYGLWKFVDPNEIMVSEPASGEVKAEA